MAEYPDDVQSDPTDLVLKYGTKEWRMVRNVFLDGEYQRRVSEINFTQGYIKHPYQGEPTNADQITIPAPNGKHYVFDVIEDDFIIETVHGAITVEWYDKAVGKAWLRRNLN